MKILISEQQLNKLILREFNNVISNQNNYNPIADGNVEHNPYKRRLDKSMDHIESFLQNNGRIMTNIDNGKDYITYEMAAFGNLMGKRCVICQLIRDNKPYGSIYVKPFVLFKTKNNI